MHSAEIVLGLLISLLPYAPAPLPRMKKATTDVIRMQGTWTLVQAKPACKVFQPIQIVMKKSVLRFRQGGKESEPWTIILNVRKRPKTLDMHPPDSCHPTDVIKAIYRLEKDLLTICYIRGEICPRPVAFSSEGDHCILVFKRSKH
jgi:uncharacterized protein (TIGR03067 family)